jgi:hypothetical protein
MWSTFFISNFQRTHPFSNWGCIITQFKCKALFIDPIQSIDVQPKLFLSL